MKLLQRTLVGKKVITLACLFLVACWTIGFLSDHIPVGLRRTVPAVRSADAREEQVIKDLYQARLDKQVVEKCNADWNNPDYVGIRPQILYIEWASYSRTGNSEGAQRAINQFLTQFPNDALAEDMHYAKAMELLSIPDYSGAQRELQLIIQEYGDSLIRRKADKILAELRRKTPRTEPSSEAILKRG